MKGNFVFLAMTCLFAAIIVEPCWGDSPLIDTDPNETPAEPNINQVFVDHDSNEITFEVTSYKDWVRDVTFFIDLDIDQNANTGYHEYGLGIDYDIIVFLEDGEVGGELLVYNADIDDFDFVSATIGVYLQPDDSIFQCAVKLKDIGNPKAINLQVIMYVTMDSVDFAPNTNFYSYNLSNVTPPLSEISLIIPEVSGAPEMAVTVPINISDATGVTSANIEVSYDPKILEITEIRKTTLSNNMSLEKNLNVPGRIIIGMAQTDAIPDGSGALVDIIFNVDANAAPGLETPVRFVSAYVFDAKGNDIDIGTLDGKVKIELDCIKGDVNNDGKITANDASLTLQISVGLFDPTPRQFCAADYNSNSKIQANDATFILQKSVGLIAPGREVVSNGRHIAIMLDEAYGEMGESITVPLKVDSPESLAGGNLCVTYDSSVLSAVEILPNDNIMMVGNFSEPGMTRIAFAATDRLDDETIASIRFHVIADDTSPLAIRNFELYDYEGVLLSSRAMSKDFISYHFRPEYSTLLQNFPNPFNPDTWIPYQLSEDCKVNIWILSAKGELVRKLDLGYKPAGLYMMRDGAAYWDGKDDSGVSLASGIYFYSIKAGNLSAVRKMIIVK